VKALFDTSVLVAALLEDHAQHTRALPWLHKGKTGKINYCVSSHTMAELYHVLTRYPTQPRIRPDAACALVEDAMPRRENTIVLTATEYRGVLRYAAKEGLVGGVIFDALIARAARKAKVDVLLTLNPAHFQRVWPEGKDRIRSP
jgi:predicted nucleic acid-binding protein